jgi:hypothetical protein
LVRLTPVKFSVSAAEVPEVHIPRVHGSLAKDDLKDGETGLVVWRGDVDQLAQATGTHQRGVDDIGSVGRTDDEDVLSRADTVQLCAGKHHTIYVIWMFLMSTYGFTYHTHET